MKIPRIGRCGNGAVAVLVLLASVASAQNPPQVQPPGAAQSSAPVQAPQNWVVANPSVLQPPPTLPRGHKKGRRGDAERGRGREPVAVTQVQGIVSRYLLNPFGEVDGLLLSNGRQVNFAPQMSAPLTTAIKPGNTIISRGDQQNSVVVKAYSITNATSGATIFDAGSRDLVPKLPAEIRGAQLQPLQRSGRIAFIVYAPRGEVRGAVLDDGSQFRFGKDAAANMQPLLQIGTSVEVKGYGTTNQLGLCLEPTQISVNGAPAINLYSAH